MIIAMAWAGLALIDASERRVLEKFSYMFPGPLVPEGIRRIGLSCLKGIIFQNGNRFMVGLINDSR